MLDPRDVIEMLAYYESYGNEAPKDVKVADLLNLCHECLRLRESLEEAGLIDTSSSGAADIMNEIIRKGIGKVNLKMI